MISVTTTDDALRELEAAATDVTVDARRRRGADRSSRTAWGWGAVRMVVVTTVVLIAVGVVLGGAVGYGLSWMTKAAIGSLGL